MAIQNETIIEMNEIFKKHLDRSDGHAGLIVTPDGTELVLPLIELVEYFETGKPGESEPMPLQEYLATQLIETIVKFN